MTNTLTVPDSLGGASVRTSSGQAYALTVTRIDKPTRLFVCGYLGDVEPDRIPSRARLLAERREQSVHVFALRTDDEQGRWLGTFHADGSATT